MKKSVFVIWAIIVIFIGLVITQNQDFFLSDQSLRLNLWVLGEYRTPIMPAAVIFLLAFISGLIIAYLFSLPDRFRSKHMIKKLNAQIGADQNEVSVEKNKNDDQKGTAAESEADRKKTDGNAEDRLFDTSVMEPPADPTDDPDPKKSDKNP